MISIRHSPYSYSVAEKIKNYQNNYVNQNNLYNTNKYIIDYINRTFKFNSNNLL